MTMFFIGVVVSIVTGLLVNELCDVSPWLARKIIHHAAHMWATGDTSLAEVYAEEWAAIIDECPGKLTKLVWALRFAAGAASKAALSRVRPFVQDHEPAAVLRQLRKFAANLAGDDDDARENAMTICTGISSLASVLGAVVGGIVDGVGWGILQGFISGSFAGMAVVYIPFITFGFGDRLIGFARRRFSSRVDTRV